MLQEKYRSKAKLQFQQDISEEQRKVLMKFLDHVECTKERSSLKDQEAIAVLYGGTYVCAYSVRFLNVL